MAYLSEKEHSLEVARAKASFAENGTELLLDRGSSKKESKVG